MHREQNLKLRQINILLVMLWLTPRIALGVEDYPTRTVSTEPITCKEAGQEQKAQSTFEAGTGRYFTAFTTAVREEGGTGDCTFEAAESRTVKVKAVENVSVDVDVATKNVVRVRALCGAGDVGKQVRTHCSVTGSTEALK